MDWTANLAAPLGRIFISLIFIESGIRKITAYTGVQAYMDSMGVPGTLLPLVIALEVLGGLAVALGWRTRIAAFLLSGFCLLAGFLFHYDLADHAQRISLMKNVAIAGGFLMIVAHGGGGYSLDRLRGKTP